MKRVLSITTLVWMLGAGTVWADDSGKPPRHAARAVSTELADMKPRDLIDIQSFIWVLGSSEYD